MKRTYAIEIIAGIFILVFVFTGLDKFWHLKGFEAILSKSSLIAEHSLIVAWAVPVVEIAISVFLFIPKTRMTGFCLSFLIILAFTIYIAYMLIYESDLPCSCGGIVKYMTWKQHLGFNLGMAFLAIWGIILERKNRD